jgi:hypothetical protein
MNHYLLQCADHIEIEARGAGLIYSGLALLCVTLLRALANKEKGVPGE